MVPLLNLCNPWCFPKASRGIKCKYLARGWGFFDQENMFFNKNIKFHNTAVWSITVNIQVGKARKDNKHTTAKRSKETLLKKSAGNQLQPLNQGNVFFS